ncbi:HAD family hydrolase [Pseudaquabacterium pictum]|uniref:Haloacid dehalogenase n=1 Tax=Pseudaquabacterium pictum TaxID=2315236 RepID=A0A480AVU9_9BURK|nr:HAD family hydrolase [Rubrivivax pictus]GCL65040.1 haloacid dehalogenase [Rubrivivax pictus]
MTRLALFDLDGTLIPGDSDHAFGEFMVQLGWVDAEAHRRANDAFYAQYQAGTLDIDAYIAFTTGAWRQRPLAEQAAASRRFITEVMQPQLLPPAFDLLRQHQQAGDLVAIVTATNEFITRPIADALGVPHLLAVRLLRDAEGRATGRIDGVPSFREGKIARVHQWLAGLGHQLSDFSASVFYSDSTNDLPLLELVSEPVATNPSPALEAIALQRGWRILRLFP